MGSNFERPYKLTTTSDLVRNDLRYSLLYCISQKRRSSDVDRRINGLGSVKKPAVKLCDPGVAAGEMAYPCLSNPSLFQ